MNSKTAYATKMSGLALAGAHGHGAGLLTVPELSGNVSCLPGTCRCSVPKPPSSRGGLLRFAVWPGQMLLVQSQMYAHFKR